MDREGDTLRAELEKKGIGVTKIERRGLRPCSGAARLSPVLERRDEPVPRAGRLRGEGDRPAGGPGRPRAAPEGDRDAAGPGRPAGTRDHPQPDRPVRRRGAVHSAAGRQPHPRPAPRRPGPGARQGADRQDRAARVQAGGRPRRARGRGARDRARRATRSSTSAAWTRRRGRSGRRPSSSEEGATYRPRLATARVSIDQNTSEPYVSLEFNARAAGPSAISRRPTSASGSRSSSTTTSTPPR